MLHVNNSQQPLKLKVDTGASDNVMPKSVFNTLINAKLERLRNEKSVYSYSGHEMKVLGKVSLMIEYRSVFSLHVFSVVDGGSITLLGLPSCVSMGLVDVSDSLKVVNNVAASFSDVFEGVGRLPSKHALRLKEGAKPVVQSPRRVPFRLRDKLKCTLADMEASKTITKVREPTDWVHPIVNV